MPYIKKEDRPELDNLIEPVITHLKNAPVEEQDGKINYIVTKLLKGVYPAKYFHYNRAIGVLTAILQEFYRRVVGPYEDTKIKEHGDVE